MEIPSLHAQTTETRYTRCLTSCNGPGNRWILGGSDFVKNAIKDAEKKEKETLRLNQKISDLVSLAGKICKGEGAEISDLCSGIRKKGVVRSRRIFCQLAVKRMGYSGAEIARFLGITTSAVNRLAASDELQDLEKYM